MLVGKQYLYGRVTCKIFEGMVSHWKMGKPGKRQMNKERNPGLKNELG
jgi:hypothetical protein